MAAVWIDFPLPLHSDGTLQVNMVPPAPISGWSIQFDLMYRFNSPQPIVSKYLASGYTADQSGCTLVDGSIGIFQIALHPPEVSGLNDGNFAYRVFRTDSGSATDVTAGFRLANPF